jgi:hypothetical protein
MPTIANIAPTGTQCCPQNYFSCAVLAKRNTVNLYNVRHNVHETGNVKDQQMGVLAALIAYIAELRHIFFGKMDVKAHPVSGS